jgi:hypothetical protein
MSTGQTARPRRDTEELVSGIRRQVRALETRAAEEDPWAMAEMMNLARELEDAALRTARRLRDAGYTWTDIGFALGVSGTTACKRYAHRIN